eukprot:514232_1
MAYKQYSPEEEGWTAAWTLIVFVLLLILTIVHASKMHSDLFTTERSVLNYRRTKPKITAGYKTMAYLTFAAVCGYLLQMTIAAIQSNFTAGNCKRMFLIDMLKNIGYFTAKCCLYLVLVFRLHDVYSSSAYGYRKTTIICFAITIIIISICLFAFYEALIFNETVYFDDTDGSWPWFCAILFDPKYGIIVSMLMVLFDFTACIAAMVAFIIPLNKVVKACEETTSNTNNASANKRFAKMMYIGYKYKVLVIAAAVTTLSWIVLIIINRGAGTILAQIDVFINPLCLVLMTPYYPNDKYYERLCIICIYCCDPKR